MFHRIRRTLCATAEKAKRTASGLLSECSQARNATNADPGAAGEWQLGAHLDATPEEKSAREYQRALREPPTTIAQDLYGGWWLGVAEAQTVLEEMLARGGVSATPLQMWATFVEGIGRRQRNIASALRDGRSNSVNEDLLREVSTVDGAAAFAARFLNFPFRVADAGSFAVHPRLFGLGLTLFDACLRREVASANCPRPGILSDISTVRGRLLGARDIVSLFHELQDARADDPDPQRHASYARNRIARVLAAASGRLDGGS